MKCNSLIASIFVAILVLAGTTNSRATNVPPYSNGDLLLGFYDYSGTITNDYLVDLGPVTNFNFNQNFVVLSSTSHMGTDLTHVFGSSWDSVGTQIVFGLAVSFPLTGQMYASNPNDISGDNVPWTEGAHQGTPADNLADIGGAYGNFTQSDSEQDPRGLAQADAADNSWESIASGGLQQYGGSGGDGAISDFVTNTLSFDEINQTASGSAPSTDLGFFSLDSAGDLSFTTAAVPEPSTYAAIGAGAVILAALRRRRRSI